MQFRNEYYFLSNMYKSTVEYKGVIFTCVETAFQAQKLKLINPNTDLSEFNNMSGFDAKKYFKHNIRLNAEQIKEWNNTRDNIMAEVIYCKFSQNDYLRRKLIETSDITIIEENNWGDTYWGVCNNKGLNKLGNILMKTRKLLSD